MKPLIPILLTVILAACAKLAPEVQESLVPRGKGTLSLRIAHPVSTRATDVSADRKVTSLQILIYRDDGTLEADASYEVTETLDYVMELEEGPKTVIVLANRSTVTLPTLQAALGFVQDYETAGGALTDGLPMYTNRYEIEILPAQDNPLAVELVRNICRIRVLSVDLSGMDAALQGQVTVRGIFLTDVRTQTGLGVQDDPSETSYLHPCGRYESPAGSGKSAKMKLSNRVGWSIGDGVDCQAGDTFPAYLYCLPNNRETDSFAIPSVLKSGTWNLSGLVPRRTHIVLEAGFGSQTWYYPVTLPVLVENTSYAVRFVLNGPGSSDPSVKPDSKSYSAALSVAPWEDGSSWTEDF